MYIGISLMRGVYTYLQCYKKWFLFFPWKTENKSALVVPPLKEWSGKGPP